VSLDLAIRSAVARSAGKLRTTNDVL
jgi:hypothetical protein